MSELLLDRESLVEKGYMPVPVDMSKTDYDEIIQSFEEALELPDKYMEMTKFNAGNVPEYNFGQFSRSKGTTYQRGVVMDNKDVFHGGAMTRQVVETRASGALPRSFRRFLTNIEEAYWCGERATKIGLEYLDHEGVGLAKAFLDEKHEPTSTVRALLYRPTDEQVLAKPHYDRSGFTVTMGESHPGLRIAPGQNGAVVDLTHEYMEYLANTLTPVEYKEFAGNLILGSGYNRLPAYLRRGNEGLPLGYHDVVKTKQIVTATIMRSAIVFFANPTLGLGNYLPPSRRETRPETTLGRLMVPEFVIA